MQRALYNKYASRMYTVCRRYCSRREDTEDMMQEGWIKIFECIHQYANTGNFMGWMRRIMVNSNLNLLRKSRLIPNEAELNEELDCPFDDFIIEKISTEEMLETISSLAEGTRTVFNLFVMEEYSHKEISHMLGISEGTSKSQLARAKRILQKIYKKNESLQNEKLIELGV